MYIMSVNKIIDWSIEKNELLKEKRNVCFEDVEVRIQKGDILKIISHPNKSKYSHQRVFIIKIDDYIYAVPFVEDDEKVFLKTIYPDRKLTKQFLNN